ncbi:CHAT domain-containing protein [Candidatus Uabimicrobium amorphum]|uniref:CHAT domain-containing protein n=1 Tax=Uabimicrobium amorphum TaxID=2596890 RepID=UPI0034A0E25F
MTTDEGIAVFNYPAFHDVDITGMDLFGTDLVVLSACETAVGEVKIGQGVYGLRHSFIIAGARTLIASLWKVPDEETKELMVGFYRKILRGSEKATALRETQLEMIQKLRDTGKSPDPYLWGAFICVGDPGKMNL